MMKAEDALGQELKVGDTVVWGAGGRNSFGVGIGTITELVPREVFVRWIEEPEYGYEEYPYKHHQTGETRHLRRRKIIKEGVKDIEVRASCKVRVREGFGRQGKTRDDEAFIKVEVPCDGKA